MTEAALDAPSVDLDERTREFVREYRSHLDKIAELKNPRSKARRALSPEEADQVALYHDGYRLGMMRAAFLLLPYGTAWSIANKTKGNGDVTEPSQEH